MKRNEVIVHEHKKGVRAVKYNAKPQGHIEPPKPRNPVAKNANASIGGGAAGAHKDAKKASQAVRGQKHKNAEMAEGDDPLQNRADYAKKHGQGQVYKKTYPGDKVGMSKSYAYDVKRTGPKGQLPKEGLEEMYGRRSSYGYNPDRDAEREWDAARRADQDFRNRERNAGVEHEDDPDWQRAQRDKDRGPWYLKIDGKIYKSKGIPKSFDWKSGASKYGMAILKNRPELTGKIFLTKKADDDVAEGEGKVTASDPTKGVEITNPETGVKTTIPPKMSSALAPDQQNPGRYTLNPKAVSPGSDSDSEETGPKVGSQVSIPDQATEEDMVAPPGDSRSPIHGDEDHDEVSKLLVLRLRRLAGL